MTVGQVGDRVVATPLPGGSGVLMSLVRADGLVRIPRGVQGFEPGATVTVNLLKPVENVRRTVVAIGSHDLTLDLLADELGQRFPGRGLSSANVGSLGGLLALSRGEAHFAGSHLLDEETGAYNISYIRRVLPQTKVILLGFVQREQGLIVPKGNSKGIHSLADLIRPDVVFINRQRGAGTACCWISACANPGSVQRQSRVTIGRSSPTLRWPQRWLPARQTVGWASWRPHGPSASISFHWTRSNMIWSFPCGPTESGVLESVLSIVRDEAFARRVGTLGGYATPQMGRVLAELG